MENFFTKQTTEKNSAVDNGFCSFPNEVGSTPKETAVVPPLKEQHEQFTEPTQNTAQNGNYAPTQPIMQNDTIEGFNTLKKTSATETIRAIQNKRSMEIATTDEETQAKIDKTAKRVVDDTTQTIENESQTEINKSYFALHKSASEMYGFKEERPLWQQKLMVIGSSIWFVIYFLFATFTVCPLSVLFDAFNNIFKKGVISMIVAVIVYIFLTFGLPIITKYGIPF